MTGLPLLPIGSVVKIEGAGEKAFMVYGRRMADDTGRIYDYLVCAYPEGFLPYHEDLGELWLIGRERVAELVFLGFQTEEEWILREELDKQDKEAVADGS